MWDANGECSTLLKKGALNMGNNIVLADTVGIDGTVYPTTGENIRNSNLVMAPKEILKIKLNIAIGEPLKTNSTVVLGGNSYLYVNGKNLTPIRILSVNVKGDNNTEFFKLAIIANHLGIKIRQNENYNLSGTATLLVGVD